MNHRENRYWGETYKMKVFISWSGHKSFKVAKILKEWIPCVIPYIEPYLSSEDIDKGTRWSTDIATELEAADFGILCVTKDNLNSTWLNFEAGALSKAIEKSRVCPFLFDLRPSDISNSPILQFQMTNIDRDDIFKLFQSMNNCLNDEKIEDERLKKMFSLVWLELDRALKEVEKNDELVPEKEPENAGRIWDEMLTLLRTQQMILSNPEKLLPEEYLKNILAENENIDVRRVVMDALPIGIVSDLNFCEENLSRTIATFHAHREEVNLEQIEVALNEYLKCSKRIFRFLGIKFPRLYLKRLSDEKEKD